jgi:hypothetical protein
MDSNSTTGEMRIALARRAMIDSARRSIDDAFLEEREKRLKLASPHHLLRQDLLTAVACHQCVPPGGLAFVDREDLTQAIKYFVDLQTVLSGLLELLPHENFQEHPQAWRMRIEVIGKAPEAEQPLRTREFFEQRAAIEDWMVKAKAQVKELSAKSFPPPNDQLRAARIFVSDLAAIFWKITRKDPRDHIRGNSHKDKYSGDFFDFADAILRRVGIQRSERAQGKLIKEGAAMMMKIATELRPLSKVEKQASNLP